MKNASVLTHLASIKTLFLWNYFLAHNHNTICAEKPSEIKHESIRKQTRCDT